MSLLKMLFGKNIAPQWPQEHEPALAPRQQYHGTAPQPVAPVAFAEKIGGLTTRTPIVMTSFATSRAPIASPGFTTSLTPSGSTPSGFTTSPTPSGSSASFSTQRSPSPLTPSSSSSTATPEPAAPPPMTMTTPVQAYAPPPGPDAAPTAPVPIVETTYSANNAARIAKPWWLWAVVTVAAVGSYTYLKNK